MKTLILAALLLFQSSQAPEEGKPLSCDNYAKNPHKCACGKAMHMDCNQPEPNVAMDKKCTTYCREQNCHCISGCTTHKMQAKPCKGHNA